jgi:hypothetical protein
MAEPSTHINYSFEDIKRYLQGKMSVAEMHAMEKAALQDAFLADAIDGFTKADFITTKQHLNEINTKLSKEKSTSKIVALNKGTQWLRIAAFIIMLVGAGVIVSYFFRSSNQTQQVAQIKKQTANKNAISDTMTKSQSVSPLKQDTSFITTQQKKTKAKPTQQNPGNLAAEKNNKQQGEAATTMMASRSTVPAQQKETASIALSNAAAPNITNNSVQDITGLSMKKINLPSDTVNTPAPVGGWKNFDNYVLSQLKKDTTDIAAINTNNFVELEFLVDKNGIPYNIQITKPLDEQRNSKAIAILKNGPKWTNTLKNKKVNLVINF